MLCVCSAVFLAVDFHEVERVGANVLAAFGECPRQSTVPIRATAPVMIIEG